MDKSNIIDNVPMPSSVREEAFLQSFADSFSLKGRFKAIVEENGVESVYVDAPNTIVNGAKRVMAYLVAARPENNVIYTLELGTGGTGSDILVPIPPQVTDIDLNIPAGVAIVTSGYEYAPVGVENIVTFSFVLSKTQGNGAGTVAYTEAGLFTKGGTMFARETFPALVKNSSRKFTFQWSLIF